MAYQAQLQNESVHPRLRGELSMPQSVSGVATGSSPLTRGTRLRAGVKQHPMPVHPRLRGELAQEICRDAELERFIPNSQLE